MINNDNWKGSNVGVQMLGKSLRPLNSRAKDANCGPGRYIPMMQATSQADIPMMQTMGQANIPLMQTMVKRIYLTDANYGQADISHWCKL